MIGSPSYATRGDRYRCGRNIDSAAAPVLTSMLSGLRDGRIVGCAACAIEISGYAKQALPTLAAVFRYWAAHDVGFTVGSAIRAGLADGDYELAVDLATNPSYGQARGPIVIELARFRDRPGLRETLLKLVDDSSTTVYALSGLGRVLPDAELLAVLRQLADEHPDERVRRIARADLKRKKRSLSHPNRG